MRGAAKKKESIFDIFKVIGALKQRFGRVSVNFGEPLKLNEFLEQEQPGWRQWLYAPDYRPQWLNDATNHLAERIAQRLNEAAAVNPSTWWRWRCLHQPSGAGPAIPGTHPDSTRRCCAQPYSPHTTPPEETATH